MPRGTWVYNPHAGGVPIPPAARQAVEERIRRVAEEQFAGKYTRLDIRFRGQFCYVDAYTEPVVTPGWPPPGGPESPEAYLERLRNTPTHLCRLRYFGTPDRWGFAFYAYSSESYKPSVFSSGDFLGPPEEAFVAAAEAYLN